MFKRYSLYCLQKTEKTANKVMKIKCNVFRRDPGVESLDRANFITMKKYLKVSLFTQASQLPLRVWIVNLLSHKRVGVALQASVETSSYEWIDRRHTITAKKITKSMNSHHRKRNTSNLSLLYLFYRKKGKI